MEPIELVSRRTALGLSQSALAGLLGASQARIAHMERGARPIPLGFAGELEALEDRAHEVYQRMFDGAFLGYKDEVSVRGDDPLEMVAAARARRQLHAAGRVQARLVAAESYSRT